MANYFALSLIGITFAANYRYAGVSPAAAAGETPAYQCKAMK